LADKWSEKAFSEVQRKLSYAGRAPQICRDQTGGTSVDFDSENPDPSNSHSKPRRRKWSRPREGLGVSRIQHHFADPLKADGGNPSYVEWLRKQSMLGDASVIGRGLAGRSSM